MQVSRYIEASNTPQALAIGNFDGMHLGHQALLQALVQQTIVQGLRPAVMTFEPHPREFFTPHDAPARLSSLREKLEHFAQAGVEQVYLQRFNQRFASVTAQDFMHMLKNEMQAQTILVGEDFRFGAKRAGDVFALKQAGFQVKPLSEVKVHDERVSSTLVRTALALGDLDKAQALLGRPYSISGTVVHGAKRGRQLGFPTANVHMRHERPALTGVYAVKLDHLPAVANLGVRPTIAGIPKLMLEVHVLDFNADLYGQHVRVEFMHKIRDEMKFENLDALKAHIAIDVAVARNYFRGVIASGSEAI